MKGRPKDPRRARRRTGHRRKPDEAPVLRALPGLPQAAAPEPPADLPEEMRSTWGRVVEALGGHGLREADAFAVEALVRQYHRMKQAGELVQAYGLAAQKTSGDVVVSPFVKAERDAAMAFLRLAEQYGLTVASRMRLGLMQLQGRSIAEALQSDLAED
ncbi:MAG TPA: phage terminase small subunit P27 family [Actinomycetota bacterium]|nr:phage terminase small subunit P27 family [Actinomycetota bacterium]